MILITYNDTSTESFAYGTGDHAGLLELSKDRNGMFTKNFYDASGRNYRTLYAFGTSDEYEQTCTFVHGTNYRASCTVNGEKTDYTY